MIDEKIKSIYRDMLLNRCSAETVVCSDFMIIHTYNKLGRTKVLVHQVLLEGDVEDTGLDYEIQHFRGGHYFKESKHGWLYGLQDDDHPQYIVVNGVWINPPQK